MLFCCCYVLISRSVRFSVGPCSVRSDLPVLSNPCSTAPCSDPCDVATLCSLSLLGAPLLPCSLSRYYCCCLIAAGSVATCTMTSEAHETMSSSETTPWEFIVEKIQQDLLSSIQDARSQMFDSEPEFRMLQLIFRFGKVLFHCSPSANLEDINMVADVETALSPCTRTFHANIPESFVQAILGEVNQKVGDETVEYYNLKVYDKSRPYKAILCKCAVNEATGELDPYKIELNVLRHLVVDVSCVDKNVDLRLMLSSKRILTNMGDDEKHSLNDLLKSAVIDPEVQGGLRWPQGKELGRYVVFGVAHCKTMVFKNSIMELKVRNADRVNYLTSVTDVSNEASLQITEFNKLLADERLEINSLTDMVRDTLKLIWNRFLC